MRMALLALTAGGVALGLATHAQAAEPLTLSDGQMDEVVARGFVDAFAGAGGQASGDVAAVSTTSTVTNAIAAGRALEGLSESFSEAAGEGVVTSNAGAGSGAGVDTSSSSPFVSRGFGGSSTGGNSFADYVATFSIATEAGL